MRIKIITKVKYITEVEIMRCNQVTIDIERFGFSYNQSRAIRYFSVNDFSREERNKKEEQMKKLKNDLDMYNRWMEELRSENS